MLHRKYGKRWELELAWNVGLFRKINNYRPKAFLLFFPWFFRLGKGYSVPLFLPVFYWIGGLPAALHLGAALAATGLATAWLKGFVQHQRPGKLLENVHNYEGFETRSFPSSEAAYSAAILAVSLFWCPPEGMALFALFAFLISYGRIFLGAHFPLDTLVGAALGFAAGAITGLFPW